MPFLLTPRGCDKEAAGAVKPACVAATRDGPSAEGSMAFIPRLLLPKDWAQRLAADTLLRNSAPPRATQPFQEVIKNRAPFRT